MKKIQFYSSPQPFKVYKSYKPKAYFKFADWIVDNEIPKVKSKNSKYYNKWILNNTRTNKPMYKSTAQLFQYFVKKNYK